MKKLDWIGSSKKDHDNCPDKVQDIFGYGFYLAQTGEMMQGAKPLKGFGNARVIELIYSCLDGTYRGVYTIMFPKVIFVLHVFQKKSKHGIETPKREIDLIKQRLKEATAKYKSEYYD